MRICVSLSFFIILVVELLGFGFRFILVLVKEELGLVTHALFKVKFIS